MLWHFRCRGGTTCTLYYTPQQTKHCSSTLVPRVAVIMSMRKIAPWRQRAEQRLVEQLHLVHQMRRGVVTRSSADAWTLREAPAHRVHPTCTPSANELRWYGFSFSAAKASAHPASCGPARSARSMSSSCADLRGTAAAADSHRASPTCPSAPTCGPGSPPPRRGARRARWSVAGAPRLPPAARPGGCRRLPRGAPTG